MFQKQNTIYSSEVQTNELVNEEITISEPLAQPDETNNGIAPIPLEDKPCIGTNTGKSLTISTNKIYDVFNNTVSTYKFYWFISILQIFQKAKDPKIFVYDIISRMIANAWQQITCYRLSFGSIDSLHKITHELQLLTGLSNEAQIETVYNILSTRLEEPQIKQQLQILTKNVPSRFLTPWKRSMSNDNSYDSDCLYSLIMDDENPFISISSLWVDYLEKNYEKLIDFSYQELASFLQKRNPRVKDILSIIKGMEKLKCNNIQRYTVVNMGNKSGIFDDYGVLVFSSTGRIKEINFAYYRFYYTYSSFTVNIIQCDEEMKFSIDKRIINVSYRTPLYKALDENRWFEQIETIIYKEKQGYSIKVLNKWYDEFGNNLHESSDESTIQAITQEKEVKIRGFEPNIIKFESVLLKKESSSVGIKTPYRKKSLYASNYSRKRRDQEVIKEAVVGDRIIYNSRHCTVIEKKTEKGIRRLIIKYDDGTVDNVPNYRNRYQVI